MADPKAKIVITAEDQASQVFRKVDKAAADLATQAKGAFLALAAPAAVYAGFKALVGSIDDLADTAQGIGVTAVQLSQMRRAAAEAGVGAEVLDGALSKLNVRITDAAKGSSDSLGLFRALGIAVTDAAGNTRETSAVLGDLAKVFSEIGDGPAKTALAVELFGKAGAKLVPYLNAGADALQRFNGLTQETVDQASKLQAEFDRSAANADKFKFTLAGKVLPTVNDLSEALRKLTDEAGKQSFGDLIKGALSGSSNRRFVELFQQIRSEAAKTAEVLKLLDGGGADDAISRREAAGKRTAKAILEQAEAEKRKIEEQKKAAEQAKAFLEQLRQQVTVAEEGEGAMQRQRAAQLGIAQAAGALIDRLEAAKSRQEELARLTKQFTEEAQKSKAAVRDFRITTDEDVANIQAETAAIGLNVLAREQLTAARQIDKQARQAAAKDGADEVARVQIGADAEGAKRRAGAALEIKAVRELQDSLKEYTQGVEFETAQLGRSADERQRQILLRDMEKRGITSTAAGYEELMAAVDRATQAYRLNAEAQRDIEAAQDAGRILADGFFEAATAGKGLRAVIGGIIDDLARMMFQRYVTAKAGDWFSSLLGLGAAAAGGSSGGPVQLGGPGIDGPRAAGGPVRAYGTYLVGEQGPELLRMGSSGGTVVPNDRIGGLQVGAINVNVPASTSRASAAQIGREVIRQFRIYGARAA